MGIRLSTVKSKVATVPVEYDGQTMNLDVLVGRFTPVLESKMRGVGENDAQGDALAEMLAEVIGGWELVDDDGAVLPHTFDVLRTLPFPFLAALSTAITGALVPGKGTE